MARGGTHHGSLCRLAACDACLTNGSLKVACSDYTMHLNNLSLQYSAVSEVLRGCALHYAEQGCFAAIISGLSACLASDAITDQRPCHFMQRGMLHAPDSSKLFMWLGFEVWMRTTLALKQTCIACHGSQQGVCMCSV